MRFLCQHLVLVVLAVCPIMSACFAFLYLEEGRSLNEPGLEITHIDITPGAPFSIRFEWDGVNWAFLDIWLEVVGREEAGQFKVTGWLRCSRGGQQLGYGEDLGEYPIVANYERRRNGSFHAWYRVWNSYELASDQLIVCQGSLDSAPGVILTSRLVVTKRQRPSDFFAF